MTKINEMVCQLKKNFQENKNVDNFHVFPKETNDQLIYLEKGRLPR